MFRIALLLMGLMLTLDATAMAADANGSHLGFGLGNVSCGSYAEIRREPKGAADAVALDAWLSGFLTAINLQLPKTYNIAGSTDRAGLFGWLDNYCRSNPTQNIDFAVQELLVFLLPTRQQSADK